MTDDYFRPGLIIGFLPSGWVPPPSISDGVKSDLELAIASHEQALISADKETARALLARLSMSVRLEDMPESVWTMHLEDYISDLGDCPADILEKACRNWRQRQKFWPTISEFLELVRQDISERRQVLERLRVLKRVAEHPAPGGEVTREWHNRVIRQQTKPSY